MNSQKEWRWEIITMMIIRTLNLINLFSHWVRLSKISAKIVIFQNQFLHQREKTLQSTNKKIKIGIKTFSEWLTPQLSLEKSGEPSCTRRRIFLISLEIGSNRVSSEVFLRNTEVASGAYFATHNKNPKFTMINFTINYWIWKIRNRNLKLSRISIGPCLI